MYPSSRLPHAWLNRAVPETSISTIDLTGKGSWTIFTKIRGNEWKHASITVGKQLGVEIKGYSIGFGQDLKNVHYDWEKARGVAGSGCVLVRPDRFVALRAADGGNERERLEMVMRVVLGLGRP
jgi:hypothetical protein